MASSSDECSTQMNRNQADEPMEWTPSFLHYEWLNSWTSRSPSDHSKPNTATSRVSSAQKDRNAMEPAEPHPSVNMPDIVTCVSAHTQRVGMGMRNGDVLLYRTAAAYGSAGQRRPEDEEVASSSPPPDQSSDSQGPYALRGVHEAAITAMEDAGRYLVTADASGLVALRDLHLPWQRWVHSLSNSSNSRSNTARSLTPNHTSSRGSGTLPKQAGEERNRTASQGVRSVSLHPCFDGSGKDKGGTPLLCAKGQKIYVLSPHLSCHHPACQQREEESQGRASHSPIPSSTPPPAEQALTRHANNINNNANTNASDSSSLLFQEEMEMDRSHPCGSSHSSLRRTRRAASPSTLLHEVRDEEGELLQVGWQPPKRHRHASDNPDCCLVWLTTTGAVVYHYATRRVLERIPCPAMSIPAPLAGTATELPGEPIWGRADPLPTIFSFCWEHSQVLLLQWGAWVQEVHLAEDASASPPSSSSAIGRVSGGRSSPAAATGSSEAEASPAPSPRASGTLLMGDLFKSLVAAGGPSPPRVTVHAPRPWRGSFLSPRSPSLGKSDGPDAEDEDEEEEVLSVSPYGAFRYLVVTGVKQVVRGHENSPPIHEATAAGAETTTSSFSSRLMGLSNSISTISTSTSRTKSSISAKKGATGWQTADGDDATCWRRRKEVVSQIRVHIVERQTLAIVHESFLSAGCLALPFHFSFASAMPMAVRSQVMIPRDEDGSADGKIGRFAESNLAVAPLGDLSEPSDLLSQTQPIMNESEESHRCASLREMSRDYMEKMYAMEDTQYVLRLFHSVLLLHPPRCEEKAQCLRQRAALTARSSTQAMLFSDADTGESIAGGEAGDLDVESSIVKKMNAQKHPSLLLQDAFWMLWEHRERFQANPRLRAVTLEVLKDMIHMAVEAQEMERERGKRAMRQYTGDGDTPPVEGHYLFSDVLWSIATRYISLFMEEMDFVAEEWAAWVQAYDEADCIWRLATVLPTQTRLRSPKPKATSQGDDGDYSGEDTSVLGVHETARPLYNFLLLKCLTRHPLRFRAAMQRYAKIAEVDLLTRALEKEIATRCPSGERINQACVASDAEVAQKDKHCRRSTTELELCSLLEAYSDMLLHKGKVEDAVRVMCFNPNGGASLFSYLETQQPIKETLCHWLPLVSARHASQLLSWLLDHTSGPHSSESGMLADCVAIAKALEDHQLLGMLWEYVRRLPQVHKDESAQRLVQQRPLFYVRLCLYHSTDVGVVTFLRCYGGMLSEYVDAIYVLCAQHQPPFTQAMAYLLACVGREMEGLEMLVNTLRSARIALDYVDTLPLVWSRVGGGDLPHRNAINDSIGQHSEDSAHASGEGGARQSRLFRRLVDMCVAHHNENRTALASGHRTSLKDNDEKDETSAAQWGVGSLPLRPSSATPPPHTVVHISAAGEDLASVAARYGCASAEDIEEATQSDSYYGTVYFAQVAQPKFSEVQIVDDAVKVMNRSSECPRGSPLTPYRESSTKCPSTSSRSFANATPLPPFLVVPSTMLTALLVELSLSSQRAKEKNAQGSSGPDPPSYSGTASSSMRVVSASDLQYLFSRLPDFRSIRHIGHHLAALADHWAGREKLHAASAETLRDAVRRTFASGQERRTAAVRVDPTSTTCPQCLLPICTELSAIVLLFCGHCYHAACAPRGTAEGRTKQRRGNMCMVSKWWGVELDSLYDARASRPITPDSEEESGEVVRECYYYCAVCAKEKYKAI